MLVGMSGARAAGGRVVFSGAVVVPTCAARSESAMAKADNNLSERSFICGEPRQLPGNTDASIYRLSIVPLGGATIAGSRLLQYFVGYRASMHASDAKMVTRTYE